MVTGHRQIHHRGLVAQRMTTVLERYRPDGVVVISGGAEGADTLWAQAGVDAAVPVTLMLPNRHYRSRYPKAISDQLVTACKVSYVVERPNVSDWNARWDTERWFVDNFARNTAMIDAADIAIVVSNKHPRELLDDAKGGTAQSVKTLAKRGARVLWLPDRVNPDLTWVQLTVGEEPQPASTLFPTV